MLSLELYQIAILEAVYALISFVVSQGLWNIVKRQKEQGRPNIMKLFFKKLLGPILFYGLGFLGGVLTVLWFTSCP